MDIKLPVGNTVQANGSAVGSKPRSGPSAPTDESQVPRASPHTVAESVTLTDTAKTLRSLRGEARDAPVDNPRLQAIKSAVQEGRYVIDDQRVAQRMVDEEFAL